MGAAEKPRVQPVRGKFVAGFETGRAAAGGSAQKEVHAQALRADAVSRTARPDRREGRTPQVYRRPGTEAVSVYGN